MKNNKNIFETILKMKATTKSDLAHRMGISNALLSDRIKRSNLSTDKLNELIAALDYKLVIVPRSRRLSDDEFLIDHTNNLVDKPVIDKKSEKEQKEDASYDLWLRKAEFSVEQYTSELEKIWGDDKKRIVEDFEKYMTWFMNERVSK